MKAALETGELVHESQVSRVIYHEGRRQPFALWVRLNDEWRIEHFYADAGDALAHAYRYDGGNS